MADADNNNGESSNPRSRASASGNSANPNSSSDPPRASSWDIIVEHIKDHKIDFILAVTRALTVLCTLSYLIGFPGPASNRFKQALLMNAATSSLRLHQRMPPPQLSQLSRTYFLNLFKEDSFHYLIFPLMFVTGHPVALALLPCSLYAIFNLAVYAISILDKVGNQDQLKARISDLVARYQQNLLHTVALSEVTMMPVVAIGVLTKTVGIFVPFLYYRFLVLRYNSTRNAHLKMLVSQITTMARAQASRYMSR